MFFEFLGYVFYYSLALFFFRTSIHLARDALLARRDGGIWLFLSAATSAGVGIILAASAIYRIS